MRRVERSECASLERAGWPCTIPAVRQLLDEGLDLGRATVLVGENGSGKSTVVEGVALSYGLSAEGGSTGARHATRASESPLSGDLHLVRGAGASRWGYFLRAETMHGLFTYLEDHPSRYDPTFHHLSHGESFLTMLDSGRFADRGLFVMDEPEAGLSFGAQLHLLASLIGMIEQPGTQLLLATHSPILASLPGATLLELDETGMHPAVWADLAVVDHYRRFLDTPDHYLRHLAD